jgi:hypothetical protein
MNVGQLIGGFYRLWANLPYICDGVVVFAGNENVVAAVRRPAAFPAGVCHGCGCSPRDRCQVVGQARKVVLCRLPEGGQLCSECRKRGIVVSAEAKGQH